MRTPSAQTRLLVESLETRALLAWDTLGVSSTLPDLVGETTRVEEHTTAYAATQGDSNGDGAFDQRDLMQVLNLGKYLTGERASFAEGDWNADGFFDQHDIVFAMQGGQYMELQATSFYAHGGRPLSASLSGSNEVPGPGDPDGAGTAEIMLNQGQGRICFEIVVDNVAEPTAAHIHVGIADVAGGVVVNFDTANNGLTGCVNVDKDLVMDIRKDPSGYYVNVHNADFPAGAVRGQLSK